MSRVYFAFGASHRIRQAALTCAKQYQRGRRLMVYCTDPKRLRLFCQALWGVHSTAFIPQEYLGESISLTQLETEAQTRCRDHHPILLVSHAQRLEAEDVQQAAPNYWLLNLDVHLPPVFEPFAMVLEVVSEHEEDKRLARERWRQYKAHGITPGAHQLKVVDLA